MTTSEDIIFAYQQGYLCGILGTPYHLTINNNIDNEGEKVYDILLEKYGSKIFDLFSDEQIDEFKHALRIGIDNKIFCELKRDTFFKCSFRKYNQIIETKKYELHKKLVTKSGYEIGNVLFGDREGIPSLIVIRKKSDCESCGFKNYCHCFSFTDNNLMLGIQNYHYGTHVCVCCGKFSENIYFKTNYKCSNCIKEKIDGENIEKLSEYRKGCIKKILENQVYYKNRDMKCLCCNEKEIRPYEGLMVCSDECLKKMIK